MRPSLRTLAFVPAALALCLSFAAPAMAATDPKDAEAQIKALRQQLSELDAQKAALDAKIQAETPDGTTQDALPSDDAAVAAAKSLPPDEYERAKVLSVEPKGTETDEIETDRLTDYRVRVTAGKDKGQELTIQASELDAKNNQRSVKPGDTVVIVKSYQIDGTTSYYLADSYRLPSLALLALAFFALAVVFGGVRGFTSVLGLGASVAVILGFIVPKIIAGAHPFQVTLEGTFLIAAVSLYLAHGFNRRTTVAFAGTLITLSLSAGVAVLAVKLSQLYGMGNEQAL
jgi:uncharacterized membrane protein